MRFLVIGFGVVLSAVSAFSATINVPADQPTIQAGINAAVNGDTVLVAPGQYTENINFNGRSIRVTSSNGPSLTVLQPLAASATTVMISNGESRYTSLSGFSITGGADGNCVVWIRNGASPSIENNIFRNNHPTRNTGCTMVVCNSDSVLVTRNLFYNNGGISCVGAIGPECFDTRIINNTFDSNARGFYSVDAARTVAKNNIVTRSDQYGVFGQYAELTYNNVWSCGTLYDGGAIPGLGSISADPIYNDLSSFDYRLDDSSPCIDAGDPGALYRDPDGTRNDMGALFFDRQYLVIRVPSEFSSIQEAIEAASDYYTIRVAPGNYYEHLNFLGKKLYLVSDSGSSQTFLRSLVPGLSLVLFVNGESRSSGIDGFTLTGSRSVSQGGAISCNNSSPTIVNNRFVDNEANSGSAVYTIGGAPLIKRNVICNNISSEGAIHSRSGVAVIESNTIAHNAWHGIMLQSANTRDTIRNNLIIMNDGWGVYRLDPVSNNPILRYNDVYGNTGQYFGIPPGVGGITLDPNCIGGNPFDYRLRFGSPCIDAGDPDPLFNDPDDSRCDIGAFPFSATGPIVIRCAVSGIIVNTHVTDHLPLYSWLYDDPAQYNPQQGYELEVGTDPDWTYAEMWNPAPFVSSDTFVVYNGSPLIDGQTYYLRLRVSNGTLWSDWYNTMFRMNSVPTLPAIANPSGDQLVTSTPVLWVDNSSDNENDPLLYDFRLFVDTAYGEPELIEGLGIPAQTDSTGWTVTASLQENARYHWQARSYDGYEYSDWTSTSSFYLDATPEPPAAYTLISPPLSPSVPEFHLKAAFDWGDALDPDPFDTVRYTLEISISPNFTFTYTLGPLTQSDHVLVDSLEFNTHYWWRVKATDKDGFIVASSATHDFWTWLPGDIDYSHAIDGSDLQWLVDYIFFNLTLPSALHVADLDGDCVTDGSDLQVMIDHIFFDGPHWRGLCVP